MSTNAQHVFNLAFLILAAKGESGGFWLDVDETVDDIFEIEDDEAEMGDIVIHVVDESLVAMVRVKGDFGTVIEITFIHFKILF